MADYYDDPTGYEYDPEDEDEDYGYSRKAAADDNPVSNTQMRENEEPEVYVPIGEDAKVNYQVLKKLGSGKNFTVFSVWDVNAQRKMAMKIPLEPLPAKGANKDARGGYDGQARALLKEANNLRSIQEHISQGDGEIPLHDGNGAMAAGEMGVAAGKSVSDRVADQEMYGYMLHKSAKRNYRFTWMLQNAHSSKDTQVSAAHFLLCNADTMTKLRVKCLEKKVRIPAEFGARCMAQLFQAWKNTVGSRPMGIVQNDHAEANVFLHSADSQQYPDCYLGDFGDSFKCKYATDQWRKATLEYFKGLVSREVLHQQIKLLNAEPNDGDRKLWRNIQRAMKEFLEELEGKHATGEPSALVDLINAAAKQFEGLEREAGKLEQSSLLKAGFLSIVQQLKDPMCDIMTFPSEVACKQAILDGPLQGLPRKCRPFQLAYSGKLRWLEDEESDEESDD
ncbi:hypothetical protein RB595_007871 [Gaeumannomyces hyphopodioides]